MTLDSIIELITDSDSEDWYEMSCWGAFSGPSYRDQFEFYELMNGSENVLNHTAHSNTASYKNDLSVTIALGLDCNKNFVEKWANDNPDPDASSHFLDIFYNGALVFRTTYVVVDGGRCYLPIPRLKVDSKTRTVTALLVPRRQYQLIKLLDTFGKVSSFDKYWSSMGATMTEERWPG